MIYIKYPLDSLNTHHELVSWNQTADNHKEWTSLRGYLTAHLSVPHDVREFNPKCWYTEMPQFDKNAQDVEHFRPKEDSKLLTNEQRTKIEREVGYNIPEEPSQNHYDWLRLNHINYRFTSALPNRTGGKYRAFPILLGTQRLTSPNLPVVNSEFPLLLDPTIENDANLLLVVPSGEIMPKARRVALSADNLANPVRDWNTEPFNFLRSWVSIIVYRLDDPNLIRGRKIVFSAVKELIEKLELVLGESHDITIFICQKIRDLISSYSSFALAARCALLAYDGSGADNVEIGGRVQIILRRIYENVVQRERDVL